MLQYFSQIFFASFFQLNTPRRTGCAKCVSDPVRNHKARDAAARRGKTPSPQPTPPGRSATQLFPRLRPADHSLVHGGRLLTSRLPLPAPAPSSRSRSRSREDSDLVSGHFLPLSSVGARLLVTAAAAGCSLPLFHASVRSLVLVPLVTHWHLAVGRRAPRLAARLSSPAPARAGS